MRIKAIVERHADGLSWLLTMALLVFLLLFIQALLAGSS